MKKSTIGLFLGRVLTLLGFVWLFLAMWQQREVLFRVDPFKLMTALSAGAVWYFGCSVVLACGWPFLLPTTTIPGRRLRSLKLFCLTQLAKYIPGNIFHLLGRQQSAAWPGLSHPIVAFGTFLENCLLLAAGGLMILLPLVLREVPGQLGVALASCFSLLALGLVPLCLWLFIRTLAPARLQLVENFRGFYRRTVCAFALYLLFFCLVSALLVGLTAWMGATEDVPWRSLCGFFWVYPSVWLAGVFTPGAPGGLGVREALIMAALSGQVGQASAIEIAIVFRVITMLGEVSLYFLGRALPDRETANE